MQREKLWGTLHDFEEREVGQLPLHTQLACRQQVVTCFCFQLSVPFPSLGTQRFCACTERQRPCTVQVCHRSGKEVDKMNS